MKLVEIVVALDTDPETADTAFGILVELEGSDRPACVIETLVIYR